MSGLLARILESKRAEVAAMRGAPRPATKRATCDVVGALVGGGSGGGCGGGSPGDERALALIAEVKFRSPSAGPLSRALDAGPRAVAYANAGAAMVSVLCDAPFFDGSYAHLAEARDALDAAGHASVPLLAKEFVVDPLQLERARAFGADAALVIVRIADRGLLAELVATCRSLALEPFVEVTDDGELARALTAGARVVGVNARDLDTLVMDAERAARVVERIPASCVAVHLSGLRDPDAVAAAARTRADAALVGEALMREDDPTNILKRMLARARR